MKRDSCPASDKLKKGTQSWVRALQMGKEEELTGKRLFVKGRERVNPPHAEGWGERGTQKESFHKLKKRSFILI